jgi:hypothetical protein
MRRTIGFAAAITLTLGLAGVMPAQASHCEPGDIASCPNPVTVAVLEGIGYVCNEARGFTNPTCTYHTDTLTPVLPPTINQGLYWPGVGPGANGPFSFRAGPDLNVPASFCASSVGGEGCVFDSRGQLLPGDPSDLGAYCGSSEGTGVSTFTAGDNSLVTVATFGWSQSAATILPLQGTVTSSTPSGGAGATVVGFTSSRGVSGGGNCGITQATTQFQVEGMIVTF